MQANKDNINEKIILENRKAISITGVESVESFSEQSLKLVVLGSKLTICGENIKISSYNKETGVMTADGEFNEIKYSHKKIPVLKRIFK